MPTSPEGVSVSSDPVAVAVESSNKHLHRHATTKPAPVEKVFSKYSCIHPHCNKNFVDESELRAHLIAYNPGMVAENQYLLNSVLTLLSIVDNLRLPQLLCHPTIENIRSGIAHLQTFSYCQLAANHSNNLSVAGNVMPEVAPSNTIGGKAKSQKATISTDTARQLFLSFDEWNHTLQHNPPSTCHPTTGNTVAMSSNKRSLEEDEEEDEEELVEPAAKSQKVTGKGMAEYEHIRTAWSIHESTYASSSSQSVASSLSADDDLDLVPDLQHQHSLANNNITNCNGRESPLLLPTSFVEELLNTIPGNGNGNNALNLSLNPFACIASSNSSITSCSASSLDSPSHRSQYDCNNGYDEYYSVGNGEVNLLSLSRSLSKPLAKSRVRPTAEEGLFVSNSHNTNTFAF